MEVHLPAPAAHEPGPVTSTVWLVTAKNALTDIGRRVKSLCEPYTWCAIFVSLGGAAWGYDTGTPSCSIAQYVLTVWRRARLHRPGDRYATI